MCKLELYFYQHSNDVEYLIKNLKTFLIFRTEMENSIRQNLKRKTELTMYLTQRYFT